MASGGSAVRIGGSEGERENGGRELRQDGTMFRDAAHPAR